MMYNKYSILRWVIMYAFTVYKFGLHKQAVRYGLWVKGLF